MLLSLLSTGKAVCLFVVHNFSLSRPTKLMYHVHVWLTHNTRHTLCPHLPPVLQLISSVIPDNRVTLPFVPSCSSCLKRKLSSLGIPRKTSKTGLSSSLPMHPLFSTAAASRRSSWIYSTLSKTGHSVSRECCRPCKRNGKNQVYS